MLLTLHNTACLNKSPDYATLHPGYSRVTKHL